MGRFIENVRPSDCFWSATPELTEGEQYHRTSPYDAILGGSEDVLGDLGIRQVIKKMPKNARL